jgi:hypothetical protein
VNDLQPKESDPFRNFLACSPLRAPSNYSLTKQQGSL